MTSDRRDSEREQRRTIAKESTVEQRLAWLEEALEFARQSGALQKALEAHDREAMGKPR
ncbi:MAG: hypothetical protein ACLGH3_03415 [Actinomycetota bacterium]